MHNNLIDLLIFFFFSFFFDLFIFKSNSFSIKFNRKSFSIIPELESSQSHGVSAVKNGVLNEIEQAKDD